MINEKDENELLNNVDLREKLIGRTEVLEKVKTLLLLPNTEFATLKQVALYYEVDDTVINSIAVRNKNELESDGFSLKTRGQILELLKAQNEHLENVKGKTIIKLNDGTELSIPNRGLRLFPRRAILRTGMLLSESKVAGEIRTQLLNMEEKTSVEVKVEEINKEQELMMAIGKAMANGDVQELAMASTALMAYKNRHIKEVEEKLEKSETMVELLSGKIKQ